MQVSWPQQWYQRWMVASWRMLVCCIHPEIPNTLSGRARRNDKRRQSGPSMASVGVSSNHRFCMRLLLCNSLSNREDMHKHKMAACEMLVDGYALRMDMTLVTFCLNWVDHYTRMPQRRLDLDGIGVEAV